MCNDATRSTRLSVCWSITSFAREADASRADAELARARVNLARARQQEKISRAALADILGLTGYVGGSSRELSPGATSRRISPGHATRQQSDRGGAARAVEETQAQVHVLDRSYYPKFYLQSSVYGRGSGWDPAGKIRGGTAGLGPGPFELGGWLDRDVSSIRHLLDSVSKGD